MPLQYLSCSDNLPFLEVWCCWESGKSFLGGLMGRPLSRRAGILAALASSSVADGEDSPLVAMMAVVVGVVVSAFRLTPFFYQNTERLMSARPGAAHGASSRQHRAPISHLGHGLGGRRRSQHGRGSGVQRFEERSGDDRRVGNVDDGGGDVGARGVHSGVGHRGHSRHLLSSCEACKERCGQAEPPLAAKYLQCST